MRTKGLTKNQVRNNRCHKNRAHMRRKLIRQGILASDFVMRCRMTAMH